MGWAHWLHFLNLLWLIFKQGVVDSNVPDRHTLIDMSLGRNEILKLFNVTLIIALEIVLTIL